MTFAVNKITLLSNPIHVYAKEPTLFYSLVEIIKSSEGDILIHIPYIICNEWMYESLREICERNSDTMLLTNSPANNGNPFGAADYLKNKDRLVDTDTMLVIDSEGLNRQLKENMQVYEAESVRVLGKDNYEVPENVTRQEMGIKKKLRINILRIFSWFRFLAWPENFSFDKITGTVLTTERKM